MLKLMLRALHSFWRTRLLSRRADTLREGRLIRRHARKHVEVHVRSMYQPPIGGESRLPCGHGEDEAGCECGRISVIR